MVGCCGYKIHLNAIIVNLQMIKTKKIKYNYVFFINLFVFSKK